jgi:hypothetical protein
MWARRQWFALCCLWTLSMARCTCVDLENPRAYPCTADGGEAQCPEGWRCGLEGHCHARDVAAPYQCQDDTDCEASWRCGPDGRCLDSSTEALRPTAGGTVVVSLLSPKHLDGQPSVVAAGATGRFDAGCGEYREGITLSAVVDGGLHQVAVFRSGYPLLADGGVTHFCDPNAQEVSVVSALPVAGLNDVKTLASLGGVTYALLNDGTFCRVPLTPGSTPTATCTPMAFGFIPDTLRVTDEYGPRVLAFSSSAYGIYSPDTQTFSAAQNVRKLDGGTVSISDIVEVGGDARLRYMLAATPSGLFLNSTDVSGDRTFDAGTSPATPWEPVALEDVRCEAEGNEPRKVVRMKLQGHPTDPVIAFVLRDTFGSTTREWLSFYKRGSSAGLFSTCSPLPSPIGWEPEIYRRHGYECHPCDEGHLIADFNFYPRPSAEQAADELNYDLFARCVPLDGGTPTLGLAIAGECRSTPDPTELPSLERFTASVLSTSNPTGTAQGASSGNLWYGDGEQASLRSLFLEGTPNIVVGTGRDLTAQIPPLYFGQFERRQKLLQNTEFRLGPLGFVTSFGLMDEVPAFAEIENRPTWVVAGNEEVDPPFYGVLEVAPGERNEGFRVLGLLTETDVFKAPFRGAAATTPDGGTQLLVSSFDALLAADVTAREADTSVPTESSALNAPRLEVKLIPLSRSPITSITVLPVDTTQTKPPLVEGYLLSAARLFRFHAINQIVWRSEELLLPEGEPLELFRDGRRTRVGYRDGSVWSVPSRVRLVDAVPAEAQPVVDYAQMCEHTFALGATGVFRLVNTGGAQGVWQHEPFGPTLLGSVSPVYTAGRLHALSDRILVFLPTGRTLELTGLSCTP